MIDTHAHLDALDDPDAAIARAHDAGVGRIVSVGTDPASWDRTLELAEQHEGVWAVLGLHPHEAAAGVDVERLTKLLAHPRVVGLGEIGLDYYWDYAPRGAQSKAFVLQLGIAKNAKLPVVIHNRAADEDTIGVLNQWFDGPVVLHCFSSVGMLEKAVDSGWYVSFAGNVTYKNASDLRSAVRAVPADRILAETDSPYLAPQPVRGVTNEPAFVIHTLAVLAEARGEDADKLERQIDENAAAVFGLS